ncbi:MAG: protein kinase [Planctomycetes bacterium]|nr:protein kinase [Planctomycetota bacterium]MCW8136616.1 protein kinase [Planctomycetota bacterium]
MSKPPAPDQKSLVGYTIGKCKLLRICGRGAMGTVYKGMHQGLDIEVAVKILPPHLAVNSNLVERFMREAKLAARLNHANTVRVYDVGEESGYYYLVMEFIDGTDALELMRKLGPQSAAVVADIGAGAARALDHAHKNDVIHRDIKPANLMLPNSGGVKVADFGLARALASESGLTMTGAIMGTPDYMAPEQAQGASVGPLADAYSLGASLYHLFVGRPPFQGATPMAVALQHVTNRIVVPEHLVKDETSRQLTRIIHELTQKDPAKRAKDLDEVSRRLVEIARGRRHTQKLLSEGATLFATTGLKVDVEAINKAKEEQAAVELDKGRVESPHLEKLRKAAEKARSGMHAAIPETPPAKPAKAPAADMAELTGDMVREARARARRSSGQLPAVRDTGEGSGVRRANSNPAMSPHRDQRPATSSSSRRQPVVQNPEMDDSEWQGYAAKGFPTFGRGAIMDGSARETVAATQSGFHDPSSINVSMDVAASRTTTIRAKPRRSGGGLGALLALVVIAGAAFGGWWFFLRDPGQGPQQTDIGGSGKVNYTMTRFKGAPRGVVTALAAPRSKGFVYSGSEEGEVRAWGASTEAPAHVAKLRGRITALTLRGDSARLAVGTDGGEVIELDAATLEIKNNQVARLTGVQITALAFPSVGLMLIGDSKGRVRMATGTEPVQVAEAPVSAMFWRAGELWVTAGQTIARYNLDGDKLAMVSSHPRLPGPVTMMVELADAVYCAIGNNVQRLVPDGLVGPVFEATQSFVGIAPDGKHLLAISGTQVVVLDPETMKPVQKLDAAGAGNALCTATLGDRTRAAIGTDTGDLLVLSTR